MKFATLNEMTASLAYDLIDLIAATIETKRDVYTSFGMSNQSPSSYVEVSCDEESFEPFKVRFSDHADRHGSYITFRVDEAVEAIFDDGEYVETEISDADYKELLEKAFSFVSKRIGD